MRCVGNSISGVAKNKVYSKDLTSVISRQNLANISNAKI